MKCPYCGCKEFYFKDPDDEYEVYEFSYNKGDISFKDGIDKDDVPQINDSTETYCNKCAWHGKKESLR